MNVLIKKVNMREKCSVWVTCLILVIFPIILTGCPPLVQCDQKITNPDLYINRVQSNPVIRQITKDMNIRRVDVASCVVNRQVSVSVLLEIPSTYSEYSLQYIDYLNLTYLEDKEALRINSSDGNTIDLEKNAVLEPIKRKIEEVENDPRVQEVIQKTKQDPLNPTNTLFHQA